ncbi:hypothetical protein MY11210_006572 [Beauveria gryllotalpidicola]
MDCPTQNGDWVETLLKRAVAPLLPRTKNVCSRKVSQGFEDHPEEPRSQYGRRMWALRARPDWCQWQPPLSCRLPGACGGVRERIEEENADIPVRGNADWEERVKKNRDARFFGAMRVHDIATAYVYI